MLEAGRNYDPVDGDADVPDAATRRRCAGTATPDKPFGFYDATVDGGWQVPGEPYVRASEDDAGRFEWWRARMLGGRTNHWGRISLRNGPYDFKPHSRDGLGFDWPIELRRPRAVLRQGRDADRRLRQQRRPREHAEFLARAACCRRRGRWSSDLLIAQRARRLGHPGDPGHRAVLTRPLDARRHPAQAASGQCHGAAHPGRGRCARAPRVSGRPRAGAAARSGPTTSRPRCTCRRRWRRGNLDIITDAMVCEVTLDATAARTA